MLSHPEFGYSTTASVVASAFKDQIKNRVVLITGVSPLGVGGATAWSIAAHKPAKLILCSRTPEKVSDVIKKIKSEVPVEFVQVDLASQASVRQAARKVASITDRIDVMINNAGAAGWPKRRESPEGIEFHLATNYLGHFLLTNLLMTQIKASDNPRIVTLTSLVYKLSPFRFEDWNFEGLPVTAELIKPAMAPPPGHSTELDEEGYNGGLAYGQSKTATMLFTRYLLDRGITSISVSPGLVATELSRNNEEIRKVLEKTERKTIEEGASTPLVAAFDPKLDGIKDFCYLNDCQVSDTVDHATRKDDAEKLWKLSEKLVGQEFNI